jgi:hypothetical protein
VGPSATRVEKRVRTSTTFSWLVRGGLVGYGLLHLLVCWISIGLLIGQRPAGSERGALADLARSELGMVLLLVLGAGFVVLAVWQAIAGLVGYRHLSGGQRVLMRLGAGCRTVTYGYLAFSIGRILVERSSSGSPRSASAGVMAEPLGRVVLGVAGLVIIGVGIGMGVFGVRRQFLDQLDDEARKDRGRRVPIVMLGEFGYVAKGIAFLVIGVVVLWAAISNDASKTGGLDQSLEQLVGSSLGVAAVAVIGTGIGCFGLYLLARARHLRPRTLTS